MTSVVIVGGGVIGLTCAARLAQAGARVTLLEGEKEDFSLHGPTASLAAAGMLAPISESHDGDHSQLVQLALDSFDLWRQRAPGAPWEDGVRFDGSVVFGRDDVQRRAAALGRSATLLSHAQWKKHTGLATRIENALFIADEGTADPIRVLSGLAMEARRYGAQLRFAQDVESVGANEARTIGGAVFEADHVLLAPGAWATDALTAAAPVLNLIRAGKGHIVPVALERPLNANLRGPGFYLARRGENDVVLGATMEFDRFDRHVDPARVADLLAAAEAALPGEVRARDVRPWTGLRPMSPDGAPIIGRSGDVLVACGHSRNGWLLAPITAEIVSAYVFGETLPPLWAAFAPDRFAP